MPSKRIYKVKLPLHELLLEDRDGYLHIQGRKTSLLTASLDEETRSKLGAKVIVQEVHGECIIHRSGTVVWLEEELVNDLRSKNFQLEILEEVEKNVP